jgi:hypothetical protein
VCGAVEETAPRSETTASSLSGESRTAMSIGWHSRINRASASSGMTDLRRPQGDIRDTVSECDNALGGSLLSARC